MECLRLFEPQVRDPCVKELTFLKSYLYKERKVVI